MIPYGIQEIKQQDIDAVTQVLRSDFLTQGPQVPRFEETVASYSGARYAVAANSATSALHIACLALDLGPGDWLWTSPITFVASANCALYCGAQVDFVDIEPRTYNMCVKALADKLARAQACGKLPKIVVPVHFAGQPCDMPGIYALSKQYGFKIIEDASHAIGATYVCAAPLGKDRGIAPEAQLQHEAIKVGSCRHSDITVFSFHPVKIITTAEGGMALTNSDALVNKLTLLRSHGITRDAAQMTHAPDGPWYYQQIELGYNYRMTELQAALGISQMQRLDAFVARRHQLARRYDQLFSRLPITTPWQNPLNYSSLHLYVIRLQLGSINKTHRQVFEALRANGIGVNVHYIPVHLQPYYQRMGFCREDFPEAERYYSEALSLPIFSTLSESDQDTVNAALCDAATPIAAP